jgi:hypothetical protein
MSTGFALSGQFRIVEGAFAHGRNFASRLAEITRARPAMGRSIDTHSLRTDGTLAIACPESHHPAGDVFHPLFGRATFGALGVHGHIIVASPRLQGLPRGGLWVFLRRELGLKSFDQLSKSFKEIRRQFNVVFFQSHSQRRFNLNPRQIMILCESLRIENTRIVQI